MRAQNTLSLNITDRDFLRKFVGSATHTSNDRTCSSYRDNASVSIRARLQRTREQAASGKKRKNRSNLGWYNFPGLRRKRTTRLVAGTTNGATEQLGSLRAS